MYTEKWYSSISLHVVFFPILDAVYSEAKAVSWIKHIEHNRIDEATISATVSGMSCGHSQTIKYYTSSIKRSIPLFSTWKDLLTSQCNLLHVDAKWRGAIFCSWTSCQDLPSPVIPQAGEAETPAHAHVQLWPGWRTRWPAGTGTTGSRPGRKSRWTQRQGKAERALSEIDFLTMNRKCWKLIDELWKSLVLYM